MKYFKIFFLISLILLSCKIINKKTESRIDPINNDITIVDTATEVSELSQSEVIQYREESVASEFKNAKLFDLNENLQEDFNGDGVAENAEFKKENGQSGIIITDGKSHELYIIGLGNKFAHMDNFDWVDYWGIVRDSTTYEILFENNEIIGDTIVKLDNPSLILRQDEAGGGIITFKNGIYQWIHQSD